MPKPGTMQIRVEITESNHRFDVDTVIDPPPLGDPRRGREHRNTFSKYEAAALYASELVADLDPGVLALHAKARVLRDARAQTALQQFRAATPEHRLSTSPNPVPSVVIVSR